MNTRKASSTRRGYGTVHRRVRLAVLRRDKWTCQRPTWDGGVCGRPANHAGHIVPRIMGGPSTLDNLRAECPACNCADGARLGNRRRRHTDPFFGGPAR